MYRKILLSSVLLVLGSVLLSFGMVGCGPAATCEYGKKVYKPGDSFPSNDGCNTCTCSADGNVACTEKACVTSCGGKKGDTCAKGQFCQQDDHCGATDKTGTCQILPTSCTGQVDPVCGCDGKDYSNACVAHTAGVSVKSKGKCKTTPTTCEKDGKTYKDGDSVPTTERCKACECKAGKIECKDTPCRPRDCERGGKTYKHGDSFPAGDGCNSCTCDDGKVSCTAKACGCNYNGKDYKPGDKFKSKDGCNDCTCQADGKVACTDKACNKTCTYNGKTYKSGDSFPAGDNCNTCTCENGTVKCTKKQCPPIPCKTNKDCGSAQYCALPTCTSTSGLCAQRPTNCPVQPEPVCGCDGKDYTSACIANKQGVVVKSKGVCAGSKTCKTRLDCGKSEICYKAPNQCSSTGTCKQYPACPPLKDPVCACDGKTYANECLALVAGTSVRVKGSCATGPVCKVGKDCKAGYYCSKLIGQCSTTGRCAIIPRCDTSVKDPVCGCDGKDYDNDCKALLAGTTVSYKGTCKPAGKSCNYNGQVLKDGQSIPATDGCNLCTCSNGVVGCTKRACTKLCKSNGDCKSTEYCQKLSGFCGYGGNCRAKPITCTGQVDPVCGCDNKTYSNSCIASSKGMSVQYKGACKVVPGCSSNADCKSSEFCAKAQGQCSSKGTCKAKPTICPKNILPVCGCDGKTYNNECGAYSKGVNVKAVGKCAPIGGCKSNSDCTPKEYCARPTGQCTAVGACKLRPGPACPGIYQPVCGCDGKTYGSSCNAGAAGQSLQSTSACKANP